MSVAKVKFKVGDRVRVVTPKFVTRVGYPKSVADYKAEAQKEVSPLIDAVIASLSLKDKTSRQERALDRIYHELGYLLAHADGFGGRERSLHFEERPKLAGEEFWVKGLRMVQTGTYYPPSSSTTYYGEHDYEPGGLANMKAHRLASLSGNWTNIDKGNVRDLEIPLYFLEKL